VDTHTVDRQFSVGQAIVTGAGIGIGDDIVNSIFDRL
jgi:hypothetical protein